MKKLILIAVITVFGLSPVFAQFEVHFGPKAGVNLASITGDDTDDHKIRTAFHLGAAVEFSFSDKFSLQPEVLYSSQGSKYEESGSDFEYQYTEEGKLILDYLNVPIMAKFYPVPGLFFEAGPQVGVLLKAEVDYDYTEIYNGETYTESGTEDVKDEVLPIDFGLNFGVGYKLDFGLVLSARYNLGLLNLNDDFEDEDFIEDEEFNNQNGVIQFSIGYFF